MQIEALDPASLDLLKSFIESCGSSLKTFRYFSNRPLSIIENHLLTLVGFDAVHTPVAYGHLDVEDATVWLGICVSEGNHGKGYGTAMMHALIGAARSLKVKSISLTVDMSNLQAARLYERLGFKLVKQTTETCWYLLEL